ncbi:MAG: hydrogenase 2 large subunit [Chloroflexi bacterium]|nr:MAG: hydrogenase 2 large subunit [Chloroflexota bacterium]
MVGFLTALGIYAILHGWLTLLLPGFGQLRAPARALALWTFAISALAAVGFDHLRLLSTNIRSATPPSQFTIHSSPFTILSFLLKAGAFLFAIVFTPLLYLALLLTQQDPTTFLRASVAALAIALATGGWLATWALIAARRAGWIGAGLWAALLIGILYFDLAAAGAYTDISPVDPTHGFQHPEIVSFLQSDPGLFRIDSDTGIDDLWQPDTAALHGLEDIGGVANPINPDSQSTLTLERLYAVKALIDQLSDFVQNAMMTDVAAVGALYADWTKYGAGVTNYLSVPDLPLDTKGATFELPGGYISNADLSKFQAITSYNDGYFRDGVKEAVKHSWYEYSGAAAALHPFDGQTVPKYTDFQDDGKYSWCKAPTFYDKRAQVGPLANVLAMYAAGHEPTRRHLTRLIEIASKVAGAPIPLAALHSTIGRIAARAVRCAVLLESLNNQWQLLVNNIAKGDFATFNRPVFPKGEQRGFGFHEAPRGVLSHWVVIRDGKIANYQAVVPSTWNSGPRDQNDEMGPYEASLIDNPVANPELPLEVLRTVHSFDPCIACAIHMSDSERRPIVQVKAF